MFDVDVYRDGIMGASFSPVGPEELAAWLRDLAESQDEVVEYRVRLTPRGE